MRHYDPHDHRLGYVTVCKPQNYTSPTASRQYDKFKVVAECLNLESVDLFNSQKFVARRRYPPEVCEFFWDSHNPGELLHNATQIRAPSGVATRIKGYSYKYRYNVQDSNGDFFPALCLYFVSFAQLSFSYRRPVEMFSHPTSLKRKLDFKEKRDIHAYNK